MPAKSNIYGWDGTQWVKILVNADGKLMVEGFFATQNDVVGSRSFDTVYQNQNDYPIFVAVTANLSITDTDVLLDGTASITAYCDGDNPPMTGVSKSCVGGHLKNAAGEASYTFTSYNTIVYIVPPDYYYCVDDEIDGAGSLGLVFWIEYGGTGTPV